MQQLTLNPQLISPDLEIEGTKLKQLDSQLEKRIHAGAKKIIVFVNQYVGGVIREDEEKEAVLGSELKTVSEQLGLEQKHGMRVLTIHGEISKEERRDIQESINRGGEGAIVFVGGQTADVGIDFSGADGVIFYNRPWSNYDKSQQAGRVFRPGLKHDIFIDTITTGRFEKGMAEYVDSKEVVIEKMLKGIPLSELEKDLVRDDEVAIADDLDVADMSLGEVRYLDEYQSAPQKLNRYLAAAKRIGSEERFREVFVESELGEQYAKYYGLCSDKGYQPNNNRLVSNLILDSINKAGKRPHQVAVLDLASGPKMLRRYSTDALAAQVVSEDILHGHFKPEEIGKSAFVGSFKNSKWPSNSFNYVTLLEAFHQTGYVPSKGNFERVEVLAEINRVLEIGGKAYLNILYTLSLKDRSLFEKAIGELGFRVVKPESGKYVSGQNFETELIVLEKEKSLPIVVDNTENNSIILPDLKTIISNLRTKELLNGLKLEVSKKHLGDTNVIIDTVTKPSGEKTKLRLTNSDRRLKMVRQRLQSEAEKLTIGNMRIELIPQEELKESHFKRCVLGKKFVLYHKLPGDLGFFVFRQ